MRHELRLLANTLPTAVALLHQPTFWDTEITIHVQPPLFPRRRATHIVAIITVIRFRYKKLSWHISAHAFQVLKTPIPTPPVASCNPRRPWSLGRPAPYFSLPLSRPPATAGPN